MPKAVFDYQKVDTVAKQLQQANTDLVTEMGNLQNTVTGLLTSGGGLYMEQASPALHDAYVHFTTALQNAMNNIGTFAQRFTDVRDALVKFDGDTQKAVVNAANGNK